MKGSSAAGWRHTVAVALATTGGLTAPALAAGQAVPSVAASATEEATAGEAVIAPLTVPAGSVLISAGRTGMLTWSETGSGTVHRWTRHADGVTTVLPGGAYWGSPGEDLVVTQAGAVFTLTDMGGAAEPVVIDTSAFNTAATNYQLQRVVGRTLVMTAEIDGGWRHRLVSWEAGKVVDRKVAVPDSHVSWSDHAAGPAALAVVHRRADHSARSLSLVDPATGALTETYSLKVETDIASLTLTPTHAAWVENPYSVDRRLVVVPRGTNQAQPVTLKPGGGVRQRHRPAGARRRLAGLRQAGRIHRCIPQRPAPTHRPLGEDRRDVPAPRPRDIARPRRERRPARRRRHPRPR